MIFIINVHNDQHLMPRLLEQIQQYPVMVIADGVPLEEYCKKDLYFECSRAKNKGGKGLWTHRYLDLFLKHTKEDYLLKIDPDTCIWKDFTLPKGGDIFGNICYDRYRYPYVKGGCIGFTREAAQKIVNSKFLLENRYKNFNYFRYYHYRWPHEKESKEQIALQDWIVGDVSHRLNMKLKEWDQIYILGNYNIIPDKKDYAITHPHPTL